MPDREKVIDALDCLSHGGGTYDCLKFPCPYGFYGYTDCHKWEIAKDALALLKEKEAVKPLAKEDDSYECICGAIVGWDELDASGIVKTHFNYCPFCGKPIDWEGR